MYLCQSAPIQCPYATPLFFIQECTHIPIVQLKLERTLKEKRCYGKETTCTIFLAITQLKKAELPTQGPGGGGHVTFWLKPKQDTLSLKPLLAHRTFLLRLWLVGQLHVPLDRLEWIGWTCVLVAAAG
jgi:hypothetical protein